MSKKWIEPTKRRTMYYEEPRSTNQEKPVFSFEHFSDGKHGLSAENAEFKSLISHLKKLSSMTWQQIQNNGRHALGSETIKIEQIKDVIPKTFADKDFLLSFRYSGKKAFIGNRNGDTLEVLFIDPSFDLYSH